MQPMTERPLAIRWAEHDERIVRCWNRTENGSETQLSMQANHYHFRAKFNDFQSTERMARLSSAAVAASQSGAAAINLKALLLARRERHQEERIVITDHKTHGHKAP